MIAVVKFMKEVDSMFATIVKFKKLMIGLILSALLLSGMNYGYSQSYYQEEDIVIALDAGHYIGEPGKRSPYDSFWDTQKLEVQYNLSIVRLRLVEYPFDLCISINLIFLFVKTSLILS